jgi:dephospho-CoA kinase
MIKVGLTGGIGSGKSTVAKIIEAMGYPVFYSDKEAKLILNTNMEVRSKLVAYFGAEIYSNGTLNTKRLSQILFVKPEKLKIVNDIVHPEVRKHFKSWAEKQNVSLVFNEAAILFETGASNQFDKNILVVAPESVRIARVMERDHVQKDEVLKRMENQWEDELKIPMANYVITNDNETPILLQTENIIKELLLFERNIS